MGDAQVADDYGQPEECILKGDSEYELGGAYIVRLPCGDPKVYLRWVRHMSASPHLADIQGRCEWGHSVPSTLNMYVTAC